MTAAKATIDHDTIRRWVEARGGCPATVKGTSRKNDAGILRIDYPGYSGQRSLAPISWDRFFAAFEANDLAFLYQDEQDSRFSKLVSRKTVDLEPAAQRRGEPAAHHAIKLLEQQHREVEVLFEQHRQAASSADKLAVFEQIADKLAAHCRIEEQIFYPSVLSEATEDELREAVEEHLGVKRAVADLLDMRPEDEQWEAKMTFLQELVEHHVEDEETELFEMLDDLDDDDLRDMGTRMQAYYMELMQGHPRTEVPNETEAAAPLH